MKKLMVYSWKFEFLALILILLIFPPHRLDRFTELTFSGRWAMERSINPALGILYRGDYGYYSPAFARVFQQAITEDPETFFEMDLRSFPQDLWPTQVGIEWYHRGSEIAESLIIHRLWQWSGRYTIAVIALAYRCLHWLGILILFCALSRVGLKGLALVSALIFAYSAAMFQAVYGAGLYTIAPTGVIMAGFLAQICLETKARPKAAPLTAAIACGTTIALASFFLTTLKFVLLPVMMVLVISAWRRKRFPILIFPLTIFLSYFCIKLILNPFIWTPQREMVMQHREHVFWHPIWGGLGEFPNPYGFEWYDFGPRDFVLKKNPEIPFASEAYEKVLRKDVLTTVSLHPLWFIGVLAKRLLNFSRNWLEFLPYGSRSWPLLSSLLFGLAWLGFFYFNWRQFDEAALIIILPAMTYLAIPVLIYSNGMNYNLTAYLGTSLALVYVILRGLKKYKILMFRNS